MTGKKEKKISLPVVGGGLLVVLIIGAVLFFRGRQSQETTPEATTAPESTGVVLKEGDEPKLALSLKASLSRGTLTISNIDSVFSGLEYEFIYVSDYQGSLIERGVSSGGSIEIPSNGELIKPLVFGVESCTIDRCNFTAEKVEVDQPATLILRFLDDEDNVWELEKELAFEKQGTGYVGVFKK